MAMKRPIVTTAIGVEGILLRPEESALFADSAGDFARAILRLFADAGLRERIAAHAFATVRQHYVWAAKGKELDEALVSVVAARSKTARTHSVVTLNPVTTGT